MNYKEYVLDKDEYNDIVKTIKALKEDLFYQIESKYGAKIARNYTSIVAADNLLKKLK